MKRQGTWGPRLRKFAPFVITAAIVAVLLRSYPIDRIGAEIARGEWYWLPLLGIGTLGLALFVVAIADFLVMKYAAGGVRYRDVIRGKAGTSMLMVVAYGVGHGGYGVWIARRTGASVRTAIGTVIYIILSDLAALSIIGTAAIWGAGITVKGGDVLRIVAPSVAGGLLVIGLFGGRLFRSWVRDPRVLKPWFAIPPQVYLASVLSRVALICIMLAGTAIAARVFGMDIPFAALATYLPVITLVASLPVNVGGFGAVQAAWLVLEPWAPGAQILAFQFLWQLSLTLGLIVRGAPFVRRVLDEIAQGRAAGAVADEQEMAASDAVATPAPSPQAALLD